MNNIMLDLETMGNSSQAAIISIGAVYFDKDGIGETFYKKVSLQSSVDAGLKIDASTILWWLQQSDAARKEFIGNEKELSLSEALDAFSRFVKSSDDCIWGNGADFDVSILASAYRAVGKQQPWKYFKARCFRTLRALFPSTELPKREGAHNALADAQWQAQCAIKLMS